MSRESMADLSGRKFYSLLVLGKTGRYISTHAVYSCLCDCGKGKETTGYKLKHGMIRKCDFCRGVELTGKIFNNFMVIERSDKTNTRYDQYWHCECVGCGKKYERTTCYLNASDSKSCGCMNRGKMLSSSNSKWLGYGELSQTFWSRIKKGSLDRGLEFSVTIEDMWNLFLHQERKCALSGVELIFANTTRSFNRGGTTASLDRIDSNLGYSNENCQWVHKDVNFMKGRMSDEDFIQVCCNVAKTHQA